jgi:glycosyltransferase involved in cell wall biosynthesis
LARQVKALGLSGCVTMNGFRPDLDRFIPFFDLLVLPSHTEGLPNIVLEALAAGVPVVATAVGGTPEVIVDDDNGYLVRPGNAEDLAAKILEALDSPQRLKEMSTNGRQTIHERFTFERQASQYWALIEQLAVVPKTASVVSQNEQAMPNRPLAEALPNAQMFEPGPDKPEVDTAMTIPGVNNR